MLESGDGVRGNGTKNCCHWLAEPSGLSSTLSMIETLRFGIGSSPPIVVVPQPPWASRAWQAATSPSQVRDPKATSIMWLRLPAR